MPVGSSSHPAHLAAHACVGDQVEDGAATLRLLDHGAELLLARLRIDGGDDPDDLKMRTYLAIAQPAADVDLELPLEVDAFVLEAVLGGGARERDSLAAAERT